MTKVLTLPHENCSLANLNQTRQQQQTHVEKVCFFLENKTTLPAPTNIPIAENNDTHVSPHVK